MKRYMIDIYLYKKRLNTSVHFTLIIATVFLIIKLGCC